MVFFNFFRKFFKRKRKSRKKTFKKQARKTFKKRVFRPKRKIKKRLSRKTIRKKIRKKIVKKPKKKIKKSAKKIHKKKAHKKTKGSLKPLKEKEIGLITHYFDKISVGIIKIKSPLAVGEHIHVKGNKGELRQIVSSMQYNHKDITLAERGLEIGIKVNQPVYENDLVYKVI